MRVIVMFDLPVMTAHDRREYSKFRKYLIKTGFLMVQESIYCKLAQNTTVAEGIIQGLKKNKPSDGLVQVLKITEKQYEKMDYIVGERHSDVLDSDARFVVL